LATIATSSEAADRQAVAALVAAHPGDAVALGTARRLLEDADPAVRAQAAWSLGSIGDGSDNARLDTVLRGPEVDPAINAAAAMGRIAARARSRELAERGLCPHVSDPRPYVRANSLAGLALAGGRCGDGSAERRVLAEDSNDDARAAAALVVSGSPTGDDKRALDRCARTDPSGAVAARCKTRPQTPTHSRSALVYVVADGLATPRAGTAFALLLPDGTIHAGTTDRRGATFDALTPDGRATLRPPSAFAR
jgi:hypothetical protein